MCKYKLHGIENELTGEVHLWITRDGAPLELEEACAELNEMSDEVERLQVDLSAVTATAQSETDQLRREIERLRKDCEYYEVLNARFLRRLADMECERDECRRLLRYVLDRAHRNAGNDDNPFTYLWQRDWDEFEQAAKAAGGDRDDA